MIEPHRCGYDCSHYADFSEAKTLRPDYLRFGYVVRLESEKPDKEYGLVVYTGDFERKVLFEERSGYQKVYRLDDLLNKIDIVYGYDSCYHPLRLSAISRPILWRKKKAPVKMTMNEICKKLGYDVEIVKEENE